MSERTSEDIARKILQNICKESVVDHSSLLASMFKAGEESNYAKEFGRVVVHAMVQITGGHEKFDDGMSSFSSDSGKLVITNVAAVPAAYAGEELITPEKPEGWLIAYDGKMNRKFNVAIPKTGELSPQNITELKGMLAVFMEEHPAPAKIAEVTAAEAAATSQVAEPQKGGR